MEQRCILKCRVQAYLCLLIFWRRGGMSTYSVLLLDSVTIRSLHSTSGRQGCQCLSFGALYSQGTVLMCFVISSEQRMRLVLGAVAPCLRIVSFNDKFNTCTITLFYVMGASTPLVIDHTVGLSGTEEHDDVTS